MSKRNKAAQSLTRRLNRRLILRLFLAFLLLDVAFFTVTAIWLDAYFTLEEAVLALVFIGMAEVVIVSAAAFQNARTIRRTLQPLTDLSAAATHAAQTPAAPVDGHLSDLAGRLEDIDAGRLDTRLPVEGPAELREVTLAINHLLERLDAAYAAQIRFVSDASHELRTPIAVIQGYASLLNRWGKDDPAARQEAIDAISTEADAMKTLIEQLLFLARGDNRTVRIAMEEVDATELAAQVLRETAMLTETHPLSADWSEGVRLRADPALLKEALRILVDNAVKYTSEGGRVVLRVRRAGEEVRLTVQDEGQGIAKESLPHVFERFYRTDLSRARQTGGSGLGLSIALWIAERHQGHIEVKSCPDLGSEFTLVLPAASPG